MTSATETPSQLHRQSEIDRADSGWRRDNWYGDPDVTTSADEHGSEIDSEDFRRERAAWVAHDILRAVARALCPVARYETPSKPGLFGLDCATVCELTASLWGGDPDAIESNPLAIHRRNHDVELTDPEIHVPREREGPFGTIDYGQHRHRARYNETYGYVTGPVLQDLSTEQFLAVVEIVLQRAVENREILQSAADELMKDARRLKQTPSISDEDALARLLEDIYAAN